MAQIPLPVKGDKVIEYAELQTDAINQNTEGIGAIDKVGSILYRLGLIKDYVVEYGSNTNGNWEKWASGKLVQWGSQEFLVNTNPFPTSWGTNFHSAYYRVTFAIPFIGDIPSTNVEALTASGGQGWSASRGLSTLTQSQECYYVRPNEYTGSTRFVLNYYSVGRWKV